MPKVRRANLPRAVFDHLLDRVERRQISVEELAFFSDWLKGNPEVPAGRWFKQFPEMIVCGEGELVKTFLRIGQIPEGEEVF